MAEQSEHDTPLEALLATGARLNQAAVQINAKNLLYARSSLALVCGLAAGILALEGFATGLLFYAAASAVLSAAIHVRIVLVDGQSVQSRFPGGPLELWTANILSSTFSYFLFWTFAFGLVHMYG